VSEVLDADARGVDAVIAAGQRLARDFDLPISSFFFLRHGRTSSNHLGIIQGQKDVPLDAVGRAQAQAAAERLAETGIRPQRIVSSDLSRAAETARILAHHLSMRVEDYDSDLRERHFGELQGTGTQGHDVRQRMWQETPPGAESIEDFVARCAAALQRHLVEPGTLIVAHGGVLRALAALLLQPVTKEARANAVPLTIARRDERAGSSWRIELISP